MTASVIPSLRESYGYNEFSVSAPEPALLKFAKSFYESPLILLLCGSAVVSAIMGNVDDAVSISIAVVIVLTGAQFRPLSYVALKMRTFPPSWLRTGTTLRTIA